MKVGLGKVGDGVDDLVGDAVGVEVGHENGTFVLGSRITISMGE
jgi:hypothetical protein